MQEAPSVGDITDQIEVTVEKLGSRLNEHLAEPPYLCWIFLGLILNSAL